MTEGTKQLFPDWEGKLKAMIEAHEAKDEAAHQTMLGELKKSEAAHAKTQGRLASLIQSIESWTSKHDLFIEAIKRAFPKDDEGRPDYDGHRTSHLVWMAGSDKEKKIMDYVESQIKSDDKWREDKRFYVRTVAATVTGVMVIWVGNVLWAAFAAGPK